MKNHIHILCLAASLLILTGCATIPEPAEGKALLVGSVAFKGTHFQNFEGLNLNGVTRNAIKLTFLDKQKQTYFDLYSDSKGMFSTADLSPGDYRLNRVEIKLTSSGNGATLTLFAPVPGDAYFTLREGVINNVGLVSWTQDGRNNIPEYRANDGYQETAAYFAKKTAKTGWAKFDYSNTFIHGINPY